MSRAGSDHECTRLVPAHKAQESSHDEENAQRQRARYNRKGGLLTPSIGTRFPSSLYKRYRDYAHFHHVHVRNLIAEAMQVYWDESLGKSYRARLKEAGQEELDIK